MESSSYGYYLIECDMLHSTLVSHTIQSMLPEDGVLKERERIRGGRLGILKGQIDSGLSKRSFLLVLIEHQVKGGNYEIRNWVRP